MMINKKRLKNKANIIILILIFLTAILTIYLLLIETKNFLLGKSIIKEDIIPISCIDSDHGINLTTIGTLTIGDYNYYDSCYTNNVIFEHYCEDNIHKSEYLRCPPGFICSNGACSNPSLCIDSDLNSFYPDGKNYYLKGNVIKILNENEINYEDKCFETDPALSTTNKFSVENCISDYCYLQEGYCSGNIITQTFYKCPEKCESGACINISLPIGCANTENSKCLDLRKLQINHEINVLPQEAISSEREGIFKKTRFGILKKGNTITIQFPVFDFDKEGLPNSPILLEIKYKDVINGGLGVYSKIDYIDNENPDVPKNRREVSLGKISTLGSNKWLTKQYVFKRPFPLIRNLEGYYTIKLRVDPNNDFPITYISLSSVNNRIAEIAILNNTYNLISIVDPPKEKDEASVSDRDPIIFVRDIMRPLYINNKPINKEISNKTFIYAAPGETEALSFGINSKKGLNSLNFEITDFINKWDKNIIFKDNFDIYSVEYDKRSLGMYAQSVYLISNIEDRLVKIDNISFNPGTVKRFWIKMKIPSESRKGDYNGKIIIKSDNESIDEINISIRVLSKKLDLPKNLNPIYHDPYTITISSNLSKVYEFYQEMNFDPLYYLTDSKVEFIKENGKIIDFNFTIFENHLKKMKEEKFLKNKMIVEPLIWVSIYTNIHGKYSSIDPELYSKLSDIEFVKIYGLLIRKLNDLSKKYNVKFIYSLPDEPWRGNYGRIISERLAKIIHENNGLTTVTYSNQLEYEIPAQTSFYSYNTPNSLLPSLKDDIDYKVWILDDQEIGFQKKYKNFGYYTTFASNFRNPIINRFLHGWLAIRTDANIVSAYAMSSWSNDPYNELDSYYADFIFAYPSWNGDLVPAMNSEGIREGIKDAKYVATLRRLINSNPGGKISIEAENYLNNILSRLEITDYRQYSVPKDYSISPERYFKSQIIAELSGNNNYEDYEVFTNIRNKIAYYIDELSSLK
ncbi:hypothetical protein HYW75_03970 [Candidatus Pacearchaeota archaeon]|nr:hypothetical protein [Candidatus Pacearchaeota archaeon]